MRSEYFLTEISEVLTFFFVVPGGVLETSQAPEDLGDL